MDRGRVEALRTDAFHDGVILALQVMHAAGDTGDAQYIELVRCCGLDALVSRASAEGMLELSGLSVYLRDPRILRADAEADPAALAPDTPGGAE